MAVALSKFIQLVHRMIMGSPARRTPTGSKTIFDLNHSDPVSFDFSASSTAVDITIPPYSCWITQHHWHETAQACETIEPQEGSYMISLSTMATRGSGLYVGDGKGFVMPLRPGMMVQWRRNPHQVGAENEATVFRLKGPLEMLDFYRQVCSVHQDAEVYFRLPSTPLWLRGLYASWAWIPYFGTRLRAWLASQLLWVQLQVIYHKNDYFTDEGAIPFTRPWWDLPGAIRPPEKWMNRELRSRVIISKLLQKWCYWIGTTLLGMRGWYEEYKTSKSKYEVG